MRENLKNNFWLISLLLISILVFSFGCSETSNGLLGAQVEEPVEGDIIDEPEEEGVPESLLRVHFIDVGQGDSIFIQLPNGGNILIDGGSRSADSRVVSYIRNLGVGKLNIVVGTHPHEDHIGGLISVLHNFKVDNLIDSGVEHTTKTYREYLNAVDLKDINYIEASKSTKIP